MHKWAYQIWLEADRPQRILYKNGFKSHLLLIKMYISFKHDICMYASR